MPTIWSDVVQLHLNQLIGAPSPTLAQIRARDDASSIGEWQLSINYFRPCEFTEYHPEAY